MIMRVGACIAVVRVLNSAKWHKRHSSIWDSSVKLTLADLETDFFPDAPRPPFPPFPPFPAPFADILIVGCVWVLVVRWCVQCCVWSSKVSCPRLSLLKNEKKGWPANLFIFFKPFCKAFGPTNSHSTPGQHIIYNNNQSQQPTIKMAKTPSVGKKAVSDYIFNNMRECKVIAMSITLPLHSQSYFHSLTN